MVRNIVGTLVEVGKAGSPGNRSKTSLSPATGIWPDYRSCKGSFPRKDFYWKKLSYIKPLNHISTIFSYSLPDFLDWSFEQTLCFFRIKFVRVADDLLLKGQCSMSLSGRGRFRLRMSPLQDNPTCLSQTSACIGILPVLATPSQDSVTYVRVIAEQPMSGALVKKIRCHGASRFPEKRQVRGQMPDIFWYLEAFVDYHPAVLNQHPVGQRIGLIILRIILRDPYLPVRALIWTMPHCTKKKLFELYTNKKTFTRLPQNDFVIDLYWTFMTSNLTWTCSSLLYDVQHERAMGYPWKILWNAGVDKKPHKMRLKSVQRLARKYHPDLNPETRQLNRSLKR